MSDSKGFKTQGYFQNTLFQEKTKRYGPNLYWYPQSRLHKGQSVYVL